MTVINALTHIPVYTQVGSDLNIVPGVTYYLAELPPAMKLAHLSLTNAKSVGRQYGMSGSTVFAEYGYCSVAQGLSLHLPPMLVTSPLSMIVLPAYYDFPFRLVFSSRSFGILRCYDVGVRSKYWNVSDPANLPQIPSQYLNPI